MFPYSQIQNGPEGIIAYVNRRSVDCENPKTYVDEEIRFLVRILLCANLLSAGQCKQSYFDEERTTTFFVFFPVL